MLRLGALRAALQIGRLPSISQITILVPRPPFLSHEHFVRHFSSEPPDSSGPRNSNEVLGHMNDPKNAFLRDVYINADGEDVLSLDIRSIEEGMVDWTSIEKRFGITDLSEEEIEERWGELERKYSLEESEDVCKGQKSRTGGYRDKLHRKLEKVLSDDEAKMSCFGPTREIYGSSVRRPGDEREAADKSEKSTNAPSVLGHVLSAMSPTARKPAPRPSSGRTFTDPNQFPQPINHKRPGYERRVMSMESEMEKIAFEVLCKERSTWHTAGADVERVLLSPNMRDLTVYYTLDTQASERSGGWWRKAHKRHAAAVRAAVGNRLVIKYVPRVHFENAGTESGVSSSLSDKNELDALFDKIAAEREEKSSQKEEFR